MTWTIYTNFRSPFPSRLHIKFGFDWQSGFRGEDVQTLLITTTTTDARVRVYYKLTVWAWRLRWAKNVLFLKNSKQWIVIPGFRATDLFSSPTRKIQFRLKKVNKSSIITVFVVSLLSFRSNQSLYWTTGRSVGEWPSIYHRSAEVWLPRRWPWFQSLCRTRLYHRHTDSCSFSDDSIWNGDYTVKILTVEKLLYLSLVTRKSFGVFHQVWLKLACTATDAS